MANKISFTKKLLDNLPIPDKRIEYKDAKTDYLRIRVTPSDVKSFIVLKRVDGKLIRSTQGRYPGMTIEQARNEAAKIRGWMVGGENPNDFKRDRRDSIKLDELIELFSEDFQGLVKSGERRAASLDTIKGNYKNHIKSTLGNTRLVQITEDAARNFLKNLKKDRSPAVHNKVLTVCKSLFNYAKSEKLANSNPFAEYKKLPETKRERFLQPDEMKSFFEAITPESQIYQDVVYMWLFTGMRKSCVIAMEWNELDLAGGLWHIPTSKMKGNKSHVMPLCNDALMILKSRSKNKESSQFVFPSNTSKSGHITAKGGKGSFWRRIVERAGLFYEDKEKRLTIHDLRRSLASWQALQGESILTIAKTLGHSDTRTTSAVYARLNTDFVRGGIDRASTAMKHAANDDKRQDDRVQEQLIDILGGMSEDEQRRLLFQLSAQNADKATH